jgi:hypothetical protein
METEDELRSEYNLHSLRVRKLGFGRKTFEREVAQLGQSEKFMAVLTDRSQEPGSIILEDIERRLA